MLPEIALTCACPTQLLCGLGDLLSGTMLIKRKPQRCCFPGFFRRRAHRFRTQPAAGRAGDSARSPSDTNADLSAIPAPSFLPAGLSAVWKSAFGCLSKGIRPGVPTVQQCREDARAQHRQPVLNPGGSSHVTCESHRRITIHNRCCAKVGAAGSAASAGWGRSKTHRSLAEGLALRERPVVQNLVFRLNCIRGDADTRLMTLEIRKLNDHVTGINTSLAGTVFAGTR